MNRRPEGTPLGLSNEDFKEILQKLNDPIVIHDLEGTILWVNESMKKMLGYSEGKILSSNLKDFLAPEHKQKFTKITNQVKESQRKVFEHKIINKEKEMFFLEFNSQLMSFEEKDAILSVARDISKRKETESKLKDYRKAMESSMDGMAILNENQEYIYLNDSHAQIYGYEDSSELIGETWRVLYDEEEIERIEENIMPKLEEKSQWRGEAIGKKKDGSNFPQELSLSRIENNGYICVVRDISERKEMKKTEDFLESILTHDLKNKIQVIQGNLQLLKEKELTDEKEQILDNALEGVENQYSIIKKVSDLKKANKEELGPKNLNRIVNSTINQYKEFADKKGFSLRNEIGEQTRVMAGSLLSEVFSNLIENSIYHSKGTKIKISKREKGNYCKIIVEDDGEGIPEEEREEIFRRGYKLKGRGGSGLGLFLSKKLVEIYNGEIEVNESELGGARFDVLLEKL